jgi:hypothetical protein
MSFRNKKILPFSVSSFLLCCLLGACSTGRAPEPSDEWSKVNSFEDEIRPIILRQPYTYSALPIDTSIMSMINRWAKDSNIKAEYRCATDYSIPKRMLTMKVSSLRAAITEVASVYGEQELSVELSTDKGTIIIDCPDGTLVKPISSPMSLRDSKVMGSIASSRSSTQSLQSAATSPPLMMSFEDLLSTVDTSDSLSKFKSGVSFTEQSQDATSAQKAVSGNVVNERRSLPTLRLLKPAGVPVHSEKEKASVVELAKSDNKMFKTVSRKKASASVKSSNTSSDKPSITTEPASFKLIKQVMLQPKQSMEEAPRYTLDGIRSKDEQP